MPMQTGAIVGIVVGCVLAVALVVVLVALFSAWNRKKPKQEQTNSKRNHNNYHQNQAQPEKTEFQSQGDTENSCISVAGLNSGEVPAEYTTQFFDCTTTIISRNIDLNQQIQWLNSLGAGSFGEVWRAKYHKRNGKIVDVAVKIPHYNQFLEAELQQNKAEQATIQKELDMMSDISNKNVVQCYGGCLAPKVAIVMEYVGGGDLYDFLHKRSQPLAYEAFFKIAIGIASGLSALHPQIVHRDLKPQNILMCEDGEPKITDFGLSSAKQQSYAITCGKKGTVKYMPPEAWKEDAAQPWKFSEKYDIYAVGLILWECITLKEPFAESSQFSVIKDISDGIRPTIPPAVPQRIAELIEACWSQSTKDRPKASEIVNKLLSIKKQMKRKLDHCLPGEETVNISIEDQQNS
eukprot:TRINITY_DN12028_c0_g1_i1.p1 TRINITY_DN12028_c0_g1~~TRINITY_DN12028_c0_g1_i1.p1  ORF type:complete len:406 (-),score=58.48 TRINITY_DN12028_c0_g1_i1:245-1462(-)